MLGLQGIFDPIINHLTAAHHFVKAIAPGSAGFGLGRFGRDVYRINIQLGNFWIRRGQQVAA
jgi:hypothetical protein